VNTIETKPFIFKIPNLLLLLQQITAWLQYWRHCYNTSHYLTQFQGKGKVVCVLFFLTEHHAMKVYLGGWRYSSTHYLTSALDGGELSASRFSSFTPRDRSPGTHWTGGWVVTLFQSICESIPHHCNLFPCSGFMHNVSITVRLHEVVGQLLEEQWI
jgi:hypothetical protein